MKHTIAARVMLDGLNWTDISSEVRDDTIRTSRGFTEFGQLKPAAIGWRFGNVSDKWRPSNPTSTVYGAAGRGMPVQVRCDGQYICTGESSAFAPDQTEGFKVGPPVRGDRWVDLTAQGVLGRIASWDDPLESPVVQYTKGYANLIGFWPCEDGNNATQLSNTIPNGEPGRATAVQFGDDNAPYGSSASLVLQNADPTSQISGRFLSASATAGWQIGMGILLPANPTVSGKRQMWAWTTSNGYTWAVNVDVGLFNVRVYDATGTNLLDQDVAWTLPNVWQRYRVRATQSGSTVTVELAWYAQGQVSPVGITATFTGTVGALRQWSANGNSSMQGARISGVIGLTTGLDDLTSYDALRSFDGYIGETAGRRYLRLMARAGVLANISGNPDDTAQMGRQKAATLWDQLQEIANTEQGLIFDDSTAVATRFRTRKNLYGQNPVVFTYPGAGGIQSPFNEQYDMTGVANQVTANQLDGGTAVAQLATGPMSIQPSPAGIGVKKGSVDVNVGNESAQLLPLASWVLANSSTPGARYPQITIDTDANPALLAQVGTIEIGSWVRVDGRAEDAINLLVIGISNQIANTRRLVTFTCVPADVWVRVGNYDLTYRRYDAVATVLSAGVAAGTSTIVFKTPTNEIPWHQTATPYDVFISGAKLTVTAMGAPTVSGGFFLQTASVTWGGNGVLKALNTNDPIHIANPDRYAL